MHSKFLRNMLLVFVSASCAWAQESNSCAKLTNFKAENVEITKAAAIAAGTTEAIPWNQTRTRTSACILPSRRCDEPAHRS